MRVDVIRGPASEPVTLQEVYDFLRLDPMPVDPPTDPATYSHPHDAELRRHVASSRRRAERITRRAFVPRVLRAYPCSDPVLGRVFSRGIEFWARYRDVRRGLELPQPPFIDLGSYGYYPASWDPSGDPLDGRTAIPGFEVDASGMLARLRPLRGTEWSEPELYDRWDAVEVTWRAGYAADDLPGFDVALADYPEGYDHAAAVPQDLKDAVLIGVQLLYDELSPQKREGLELGMQTILLGYRVPL